MVINMVMVNIMALVMVMVIVMIMVNIMAIVIINGLNTKFKDVCIFPLPF